MACEYRRATIAANDYFSLGGFNLAFLGTAAVLARRYAVTADRLIGFQRLPHRLDGGVAVAFILLERLAANRLECGWDAPTGGGFAAAATATGRP